MTPISRETVKAIAALAPTTSTTKQSHHSNGPPTSRLDIPKWLNARGRMFYVKPINDGRTGYILAKCPFDESHGIKDEVAVYQADDGKLSAKCMHSSCNGKGWQEFKEAIGAPDNDHWDPPLRQKQKQPDPIVNRDNQLVPPDTQGPNQGPTSSRSRKPPVPEVTRIDLWTLASEVEEAVPCIVDDILPAGCLITLGSLAKRAKSTMALHLIHSIATSNKFLGRNTTPAPCLYFNAEMPRPYLRKLSSMVVGEPTQAVEACDIVCEVPRPFGLDVIAKAVEVYKRPGLVVLDSFRALWPMGPEGENQSGVVGPILRNIADWCHTSGWAAFIIHHFHKMAAGEDENSFAGSGEWAAACDVLWLWHRKMTDVVGTLRISGRLAPVDPMAIELSPSICHVVGSPMEAMNKGRKDVVLDHLPKEPPGWTYQEVKERTFEGITVHMSSIKRILNELLQEGSVKRTGDGTKRQPHSYWKCIE
jgi:hypothetical protein